ncbi:MAG: hypothetical protein IKO35_00455 [Elusimicrobiaceae bacterium]|nr:hypothetical protein [Elusimicrobiaceae bacterium]
MRFIGLSFLFLWAALPSWGQLQRACQYGVIPTDNITMVEVNPSLTVIDDSVGISNSQLTFKTYRVINAHYNWGIEVPLARYESPAKSVSGLGDTAVSISWVRPESKDRLGMGAKMEFFIPTATDKRLGSGQLQASPSVFAVWTNGNGWYVAGAYKHYLSVIGDRAREDINYGRFRFNISYLSERKWWVQTNLYYYQNFHESGKMELVPEIELGTLVNEGTAFYINGGTHAAGNWHSKDWNVGVGFKILYL